MNDNSAIDNLKEMTARIENMMLEAQNMAGTGSQMKESIQTVGAFTSQQEEREKEAWREAVRAAALSILPALPEMNLNSRKIKVGEEMVPGKRILGVPIQSKKKVPIIAKAYPLAYMSEDIYRAHRTMFPPREQVLFDHNTVKILVVDESGKLWLQYCSAMVPQSIFLEEVFSFMDRPISLVRSRQEIEKLTKPGVWKVGGTVPILVESNKSKDWQAEPWEAQEKCQLNLGDYQRITGMINQLFADHQAWMSKQAQRINKVLEKANSPLLKEIVKVPSLKA